MRGFSPNLLSDRNKPRSWLISEEVKSEPLKKLPKEIQDETALLKYLPNIGELGDDFYVKRPEGENIVNAVLLKFSFEILFQKLAILSRERGKPLGKQRVGEVGKVLDSEKSLPI